jgi:hypothetical protein
LRVEGLQVALLDARASVSGTASNYAAPERRMNLDLKQGSSGAQAIAWAAERWKLPAGALPRAPVALSNGHVEWIANTVALQGTASFADGVQAQFDLALLPEGFDLRRLVLRDVLQLIGDLLDQLLNLLKLLVPHVLKLLQLLQLLGNDLQPLDDLRRRSVR